MSATRRIRIWFLHTSLRARARSFAVLVSAAKGGARGAPPREALIAVFGKGVLEFAQDAGKRVVVSFKQAELFREAADFGAAFFEQLGLLAFEALLFFLERLEAPGVISGFLHVSPRQFCSGGFSVSGVRSWLSCFGLAAHHPPS
ncbi:MAG: hypothetical protein ACREQR_05555 [Candidatus Binataceae bacterium]